MAGIKELEEVIDGICDVLDLAKSEGSASWSFDGTTLRINSTSLAVKLRQVLDGIDRVQLQKEGEDLSTIEMIKLYKRANNLLPKILGH